ncbi:MAG: type I glutamate--ammonia ligase [Oscillospiraceae bacterium]|nr:type I glutamate--ammonia ligase [Oscillospiraceae bacterium]
MVMLTKQDIFDLVEEEDVRFIRLQFTDMLGAMRNMAVTTSKLEDALNNLCMLDGSSIKGFVSVEESDLYLHPDLDTFSIFPWRPHQGKVARLICDVYTPDGRRLESDPRYILQNAVKEAEEMGYSFEVGPECEFFLFNTDERGNPTVEPHDNAGYFDLAPLDNGENCRREICLTLEEMGYKVEASHHEMAPGQHEITFRYDDALKTADRIVTFRTVVKTIAKRNGLHATFMPKPMAGVSGSGMHLTMSLKKDGKNVFYNESDPAKLSDTAAKFAAGLLKYTPDMACFTNPTVNSYKRFTPGYEAPCYISWSESNRSLLLRVPSVKDGQDARIELRSPDPTANPYLALAACLKAGLRGIKDNEQLPPSIDVNIYSLSDKERESLGIKSLPISLNEAIKIARKSDFVKELLGEKFAASYFESKEQEYGEYRQTINQWEIEKYSIAY